MLKENALFWTKFIRIFDLVIVTVTFLMVYHWRYSIGGEPFPNRLYFWMIPFYWLLWGSLLHGVGMYESWRLKRTREIIWKVLKAGIAGFLVFATLNYLFKSVFLGRAFAVLYFSLTVIALCLQKILLRFLLEGIRRHGKNYRNALLVGITEETRAFLGKNHTHPETGLKVVGLIDHQSPSRQDTFMGLPVFGDFNVMPALLHTLTLDYVFFMVPKDCLSGIEPLVKLCETHGITTSISLNMFKLDVARHHLEMVFDFPMMTFKTTRIDAEQLFVKRSLDILFSALALIVLSPLFLALALLVRLTSPGPAFFRQRRCTLNGRDFMLYKFRTMTEDAEQKIELLKKYNEMQGPAFKMENDPRVTTVGRWLRKFSLDELPQLWNVLRGDMSIVGPRPPLPAEVADYQNWQRRKLRMRSGLTCLWQVNGRNQITDFNQWAKLDLSYIDNWSLWLDFQIIFKTFRAVLSRAGAK